MTATTNTQEQALARLGNAIDTVSGKLMTEVTALDITSADTYQQMDQLLFRARSGKKLIEEGPHGNDGTESMIRPIRQGLDRLYEFARTLKAPFDRAEKLAKEKMGAWQESERRRIAAEEEAARAEARRKADIARQAEEEAARATSISQALAAQETAAAAREELDRANARLLSTAGQRPVRAAGSKVTVKTTWEVDDMEAFVKGVVAGKVPMIALAVNEEVVEAYFQKDRGLVSVWPGLRLKETTIISGR